MANEESNPNENEGKLPTEPEVAPEVLGEQYVSEVTDHINRKATEKDDPCPVCGSPINIVSSSAYKLVVQEKDSALDSGRQMPLLATVCRDCGYTRFFNRLTVNRLIEAHQKKEGRVKGVVDGS